MQKHYKDCLKNSRLTVIAMQSSGLIDYQVSIVHCLFSIVIDLTSRNFLLISTSLEIAVQAVTRNAQRYTAHCAQPWFAFNRTAFNLHTYCAVTRPH